MATFFSPARRSWTSGVKFEGEVLRMYLHIIVSFQDVVLKSCFSPLDILRPSSIIFTGHGV